MPVIVGALGVARGVAVVVLGELLEFEAVRAKTRKLYAVPVVKPVIAADVWLETIKEFE